MPLQADPTQINAPMEVLLLFCLIFLATMVYGPLGAFLVEQFSAKVRYSGVSVSLQFGNGWIGGFAPFIATALAVSSGDIFHGLLYTIGVALLSTAVAVIVIRDKHHVEMGTKDAASVTLDMQALPR
ncbi:hypothetical protein [Pseudomonas sp. RIT-PI-q]|uniref:hypothetical protein n=1 Tax=Pseudomonas sp. RIT-PI-q TaxID=1690247 RepID=UPI0007514EE9|nr:hypothetical protein [Pseudomonas sp. RIT-PI-q]